MAGGATPRLVGWMTPAGRVLCCGLLVAAVATAAPTSPGALCAGGLVAAGVVALTRPPWAWLWRRALPALGVVGAMILPVWWARGAAQAGAVGLRATLSLLIALGFAARLRLDELGAALGSMGVPFALAHVVETLLRQLSVVRDEGRRLLLARGLRGARGLAGSADIVSELLVRTAGRAERVELAAALRGAQPARRRRLRPGDLVTLLVAALAALTVHAAAELDGVLFG